VSEGQQGSLVRHSPDLLPAAPASEPSEITGLIRLAIERDLDVEKLERLVALRERVMDREAAAAFADAIARFQRDVPPIPFNRRNQHARRDGARSTDTYADLEQIARYAGPVLAACDLSYSFDTHESDGRITTTCTVRHAAGHSQSATISFPFDSRAGMSEQQKVASANTYGRRYALTNALGLTTTEDDTDGQDPLAAEPLDAEQVGWIEELLHDLHGDRARFLAALRAETTGDLTRGQWRQILTMLRAKAAETQHADAIARVDKLLKEAP
jgi:hypothetical protein